MALELGTAWITIAPSMRGFRSSVEKELGGISTGGAEKRIQTGMSSAFGTVAKIGAGAMGAVATAAGGIGVAVAGMAAKGGIDRALNIEGAKTKLAGLGHSTEDVAAIMDNATTAVKGTAFGLDEAATVAAQFSAVGIESGQNMTNALSTVADVAQISGRSMTDIGTIFSSVAAKGKLDGQDMLQLTSSGIPVLQLLADKLGVTSADVSKMVSQGKIDFQTFADAMQAGMGGAALNAGNTFQGALANVKAALSRLGASAAAPALDALKVLFIGLIPVIDQVTAAVKPAMDALGPQLESAAQAAVGSFGQLGQVLGQSLAAAMPAVSDALVQLIGLLPQIIGSVGQLLPQIIQLAAQVLPMVVQAAVQLMPAVLQIVGVIAQLLPTVAQLATALLPILVAALLQIVPALAGAVSGTAQFASQHTTLMGVLGIVAGAVVALVAAYKGMMVVQQISSFVRTMAAGLQLLSTGQAAAAASTALTTAGYTANASAVGILTAAQGALNAVMSINPFILIGIAIIAFIAVIVLLWNKCEGFRNAVITIFGAVRDFFVSVWNGMKTAAEAVANWFTSSVVPVFEAAWNGIKTGLGALKNFFQAAWQVIKDIVAVVATAIYLALLPLIWFWQNVMEPTLLWLWHNVFEPAWNGIKAVVEAVAGWFTGTLVPMLQNAWDAINAALQWLWHNIFEPVWNGIRGAVDAVAGWFTGTLVPMLQNAWGAVAGGISWLRDRFSDIWNWIKNNIVSPIVDWFQDHVVSAFNNVKDGVVSAFNVMKDGISNAWNAIKDIAAVPVRFVVNTVAAGIVNAYNKVASKFGADQADVPHVDFAVGGYTGAGGRLQPAGVVHKGEVVWSQADVARWGGPGVVEAMRTWRGYDKGGFVGDAIGGHDLGTSHGDDLGDIIKQLVKGPVDFFKGLIGNLMDGLGSSSWVEVIKGVPRHIAEAIGNWVKDHMSNWFGGGSGSEAFDGWWNAAVAIIPEMAPYKGIAAKVAEMESGFNPAVQNNWDSNAAAGTPSAGLMQFIQPTFAAYHHPGFENWLGAVDQLLAWWHYVNARYGGPMNIPGIVSMSRGGGYVGYARGTSNAQAGLAWVGENGPELIRFRGGEQVVPNSRLAEEAGGRKYVFAPTYYDDGRSVRRDFEDWRHALGTELV